MEEVGVEEDEKVDAVNSEELKEQESGGVHGRGVPRTKKRFKEPKMFS